MDQSSKNSHQNCEQVLFSQDMDTISMNDARVNIVFEDEEIQVLWFLGSSEFVMVTFGDLISFARDGRFFADTPIRKSNISCIGFMAKRGNWYPKESMLTACRIVESILRDFKDRVFYGGSMGGYAALKYSRLLGATEVIALCPQWSIDPAECDGIDPGWNNHFLNSMTGMGIQAEDLAGDLFVFVDLYDTRDNFHCKKIANVSNRLHVINVPMVSHHVTSVFAGTKNLLFLIDACRIRDLVALRKFSRVMRRASGVRVDILIRKAKNRHPKLLLRILDNPMIKILKGDLLFCAVDYYWKNNDWSEAEKLLLRFRVGLLDPVSQLIAAGLLIQIKKAEPVITTHHETILIYDLSQDKCVHKKYDPNTSQHVVKVELTGTVARLFVEIGGIRINLCLDNRGFLVARSINEKGSYDTAFDVSSVDSGSFNLAESDKFLSANSAGVIICNRDKANKWENFIINPLWAVL